ncbi:MAG TPA: hypothetical protein VGM50_18820, partial [Gemmatimonadaceae bacterium]
IKRLGLVAAIFSTFGFSCYNEPHYPTPGMTNSPSGSGWGTAPAPFSPPAGVPAAGSASANASTNASKAATKKQP